MNKSEFIEKIVNDMDVTKAQATEFVDTFIKNVVDAMKDGDSVKLIGFGNFEVKVRGARKSRNPRTGETVDVPETKVPSFKVSPALKKEIKES